MQVSKLLKSLEDTGLDIFIDSINANIESDNKYSQIDINIKAVMYSSAKTLKAITLLQEYQNNILKIKTKEVNNADR